MLYADDAGVVSQSLEQLKTMMVVVCAAFGLSISEAKTETTFTYEGYTGVHRHIRRRDSGPGVQPNERVRIPRGERQPQCYLSIEVNPRIRNAWGSFQKYTLEL